MNYEMVLVAGLLAGATTCAVTQGGLLVGLIARQRGASASPQRGGLGDDLAPVGGFLAGKLVSHTAAGLVLGAAGSACGVSPRSAAFVQLLAGVAIVVLGLGSLGVPGARSIRFTPPDAWLSVVRTSTRSKSAVAPFVLGLTVLIVPCGVTVSMALLAASSGSALAGAAVMGLFVLGTAPMFALYGYISQRLTMSRVMSIGLAAVVVAVGLVTVNAGLVAVGSPLTAQTALERMSRQVDSYPNPVVASDVATSPTSDTAAGDVNDVQMIEVEARNDGYYPRDVVATAGTPIQLIFTTRDVWSCVRATTMPTLGQQVMLPTDGTATLDLGVLAAGDYPISCSMGMYTATLRVTVRS